PPLADSRRDTFDIAAPHIANREHSGQTRLEKIWTSGEWPVRSRELIPGHVGSSLNEPLRVQHYAAFQPPCGGSGARHHEDMSDVMRLDVARVVVPPAHALEMILPFESNQLCTGPQVNHRAFFDAPNQIAGHGLSEPVRANEHVHLSDRLRKENGRSEEHTSELQSRVDLVC